MTAVPLTGRVRIVPAAVDLGISLLLAGVAFWAGMEWLRAAYAAALDDVREDLHAAVRDSARQAAAAVVDERLATLFPPAPPAGPRTTVAPAAAPKEAAPRKKFPRQGEPKEAP